MALVASGIALGFGPVLWTLMFMLRHTIANLCWAFAKSKNKHPQLFDMWLGHWKKLRNMSMGGNSWNLHPWNEGVFHWRNWQKQGHHQTFIAEVGEAIHRRAPLFWSAKCRLVEAVPEGESSQFSRVKTCPRVILSRTGHQETVHVCFTYILLGEFEYISTDCTTQPALILRNLDDVLVYCIWTPQVMFSWSPA